MVFVDVGTVSIDEVRQLFKKYILGANSDCGDAITLSRNKIGTYMN
jgi:hypothetical protein